MTRTRVEYCDACGRIRRTTRDHIWERNDAGYREAGTTQRLCKECHIAKTKFFAIKRKELGRKMEQLEALEFNKEFLSGFPMSSVNVIRTG